MESIRLVEAMHLLWQLLVVPSWTNVVCNGAQGVCTIDACMIDVALFLKLVRSVLQKAKLCVGRD